MSEHDRTGVWLRVAAALMAGAGVIHASAAGQHADHGVLAAAFAAAAAGQVAWAVAAAARPGRQLAGLGTVLAALTVGAWACTRLVAVGAVDGLDTVQAVGAQDALCVALELGAGVACLAALARLRAVRALVPSAALLAVALAVPASAMVHAHGNDDAHAHAHAADPGVVAAAGSADHTDHTDHTGSAGAAGAAATPAAATPATRPASREQLARAAALVETTTTALARYRTVADVEAAGYRSIGDGLTGWEHFVHRDYLRDGRELDPDRIESIVFQVGADRSRTLVSGMYILENGKTMADVPDVGGPLTVWHDHQNLCWDAQGRVVGVLRNGSCFPRGTFAPTAPMLHVWLVEHPCGPFAGIEGDGPLGGAGAHGDGCAAHAH